MSNTHNQRALIVTHHAPDLDACAAVWLLKRFDAKNYADAKVAFVNPGDRFDLAQAEKHGVQLHQVTHVDTGLGRFDHHQADRGQQYISAASLVHDYLCGLDPNQHKDEALQTLVDFATEIDHFGEIHWPETQRARYCFMIHELIRGFEFLDKHDDDAQLHFALTCLDSAYAVLKQHHKAQEILSTHGTIFDIAAGSVLAIATRNNDVVKLAQKSGHVLVIKKDPSAGNVSIKARPDSTLELKPLYEQIIAQDTVGSWFYHQSGKMLINGSSKHKNQTASPLKLDALIALVTKLYKKEEK